MTRKLSALLLCLLPFFGYAQARYVNVCGGMLTDADCKLAKSLGFQGIRVDFSIDSIERFNSWWWPDRAVENTQANGLKLIAILDMNSTANSPSAVGWGQAIKSYAATFQTCIQRYGGKGIIWELGNEPDMSWFGSQPVDLSKYAQFVNACMAVKGQETVMAWSISNYDRKDSAGAYMVSKARNATPDVVGVHVYRYPPRHDVAALVRAQTGCSRVAVSEQGFFASWPVSSTQRAAWSLEALTADRLLEGVCLFELRQRANDPASWAGMGLVDVNGVPTVTGQWLQRLWGP